jgi:hypothetical protein
VGGELLFRADTSRTITITNFPQNPDLDVPVFLATLLVNPIFRAGVTYKVPLTFTPPGVFQAHNLVVGIEAGFTTFANVSRSGITPLNDYRQISQYFASATGVGSAGGGFVPDNPADGTIRWTSQQQVLGDFAAVAPFIPYLWNIIDEKSGRQYSQQWMPHGALLNTRANGVQNATTAETGHNKTILPDSEFFEFDHPWQFERDGQVSFLFRPLMDLFQIAAADAQMPYGNTSDLSGGRREHQATVVVEMHGNRYYTSQDVLKDGAYVTNQEEYKAQRGTIFQPERPRPFNRRS